MFTLSKLTPPPGILMLEASQNSDALLEAARGRLREAMHQRDKAAVIVTDKQSAVFRVQALIQRADAAEQALDTAEEQSAEFTAAWAKDGAHPNRPAVSTKLKEMATEAAAEARAARIASDGAATGLPVTEAMLADATRELEMCQSKVHEAVAQVLAAMTESALARAEQAGQEFEAASREAQTVVRVLAGHWHKFSNDGVANDLLRRLREAGPSPIPARSTDLLTREGEEHIEAGRQFVELGHRLMVDPDANP